MSRLKKIINSFSIRETLNSKVWENSNDVDKSKMKPRVREALLRIAEKFVDYLGDDIFVEDIVLTGSLSNFNWSEFSDFDLHVYIDFDQFGKDSVLYKELFDLKKFIFNERHNIKIFGYDVELYAQDTKEAHYSTGVYSVMFDKWIEKPEKIDFQPDEKILINKIKCWVDKIDKVIQTEDIKDNLKLLETLKSKLKEYRKSGLEREGELSYENLVFKFLRRSGHIQKLFDATNMAVDAGLSVETKKEE